MNLSRPQKMILELEQVVGGSIANICGSMLVKTDKSVAEMQKAVNDIYRLNDALRLRLVKNQDGIIQKVIPFSEKNINVLHFDNKELLDSYSQKYAKAPFDFGGSLCDIQVVVLPDCAGVLVKYHHIVGDGWTISLIGTQFNDLLHGLEPISYSYVDYIESEKKYCDSKRYLRDKEYYLSLYNECEEMVYISSKNTGDFLANRKSFVINSEKANRLKNFASTNNISLFTLFFATTAVYISKLADYAEKFFLGTTVLNRSGDKEQNTMGMFVNTIPVLVKLSNESSFECLLKSMYSDFLSSFRHQKFNYRECLNSIQKNNNKAFFDVIIDYQNSKILGDEVHTTWYHNDVQAESLQIHIDDRDSEGIFKIHYDYQIEKFTEEDINRLHMHLCTILDEALENPDKKISEINMLSDEEKNKILNVFNDTAVDYQSDKCVHQLFEEQVEKESDKVAVVACDKTLTYAELNEEANRIAHSLIEKGVGKGDIVAFMLPRRSYLIATMLGILKSGAAYMPIDPDYPSDRIEYMLEDCCAKICITDENISELLNNAYVNNPDVIVDSADNCYCIYTSGSTGKPKGTLLTHRNIVNYVNNNDNNIVHCIIKENYKNIVSVTTVGFDIFVTESLLPLANGMEIILASEEQAKLQGKLNDLIKANPVDVLQTTPTKMKSFIIDKQQLDYLKSVKVIILGGEALEEALVEDLKSFTDAKIFNVYGPTEATVWVTNAEIKEKDITIGKPTVNTQIYIVDKYMNPVPIGVIGELCIAGDCIGVGYLNRPELTAEKFIDNPFGEGKLYKTGDLAYWREDGNIIFVGRNDFQVKIRGLRIELGEIESAVSAIDGIDLSVAVVRNDKEGRQLICAFYTGEEKNAQEIKSVIGKKLPKYMLPHIFTRLDEMPLTASGKINRKALPEVKLENIITETEYVAAENKKEEALSECVESILGIEKVSMLDNFFDVGGDSLKAIELSARLEGYGYKVSVKTIFTCAIMKELAASLEEKAEENTKAEYDSEMPATAAQLRIYTAQMISGKSTLYNIPYVFKAENVDRQRLESAINSLIKRHESLRTHFENRNGTIYQVIDEATEIKVEEIDDINSFSKPFDLGCSPMIRVGCKVDTIVFDMHHIAVDGETLPVFFKELNELYMGRIIKDEAVQYGEFALEQSMEPTDEKYWMEVFSEDVPELELPKDYQRPAVQSFNGSVYYKRIEKSLHEKIEEKCKETGVTPFVYYMACFSVLAFKLSGNEDVVIGTPMSGRTSRFLDTVGMFVNTVALRSKPEGNKSFARLMQEIKQNSISAIENQNYPFGMLIKKLGIKTEGRNSLYDVMLAYQSYRMTDITFGDKKVEVIPFEISVAKCDLTFNILPRENDVVIAAEYCTDLFKEERIEKFTSMYNSILEICLDEDILLKDVSVSEAKVVNEFNRTEHSYEIPDNSNLYSLFENTAKENGDKICIRTAEKEMTFAELLGVSENLDSKIRSITNNKKSVIAVIAERSAEMYSAIYGIIRGGNAYLPIDPDYPRERIDFILRNSEAKAVVAQGKFAHFASNIPCVNMTEFIENTEKSDNVLPCGADENDTAYVIYTSGSTGNPKGAMISHKSAINRILWMHDKYPLGSEDVILQKTPYTFDVSVWEIFWWGITGGCLCASKPQEHFLPAKILEETENNKVTHLHFVPSVFELFLNYLEANCDEISKFSSVKYVFVSGEALMASSVQRFYKLFDYDKVTLHNLYGPTECAVDVTYYDCVPTDADPVPIGKPVYNTQMYVVDKYMNLQPLGVVGELCIAGINVGQGYLNNPYLTAEKFIDNPFGEGKLYKTGDLAYWREDGNIIFVGRNDFQVKIRGLRIELGEIESAVSAIDGIDLSVAVVRNDKEGRQLICAFYTGEEKNAQEIKSVIGKKLPKYMLPHIFTHLDEMPLTASGKINRKALDELEIDIVYDTEYEVAADETEKFICDAFCKTLETNYVGRKTDFFESGGTSLSMISLLSEPGFERITPSEFMRNPTAEKLAVIMKKKTSVKPEYLEPLYIADNSDKALILIPFAGGGAEAFSSMLGELKKINGDVSVYFVRCLHSYAECEKAAEEIEKVLSDAKVTLYSHCVGSAVALTLLSKLEKDNFVVKHYYAGAVIPPVKTTEKNIWNKVPDTILKGILVKAGAELDKISAEKQKLILTQFRKDTDFANKAFCDCDRIKTPVTAIISKRDLFTLNYRQAEKAWKKYAENLAGVEFIDSKSHYFQTDNSESLVKKLKL